MRGIGLRIAMLAAIVVCALPAVATASSVMPSSLTLSGPSLVLSGGRVTLSGYLTNTATERHIMNGTVTIYYAAPGAAHWTAVSSVRTNSQGYYAANVTVHSTVYFYAAFRQVSRFGGANTGNLKVTVPAVANGSLEWGSDWCLYEGVNGAWQGQWCVRRVADSSGQPVANQYWVYAFNPNVISHLGGPMFIWDPALSNSDYFVVRGLPNQPSTVAWLAAPLQANDPGMVESAVNGQYEWLTPAQYNADAQAGEIGGTSAATSTTTFTVGGGIPAGFQSLANGTGANDVLMQLLAQSGGGNPLLNRVISDYDFDTDMWAIG